MVVMILDDEDYKVEQIKTYVEKEGHEIIRAKSFQDGILALVKGKKKVDAIFLDMYFPQREGESIERDKGEQFIETMKWEKLDIPVCLYTSANVKSEIFDNGFVIGYIGYDSSVYMGDKVKGVLEKMQKYRGEK